MMLCDQRHAKMFLSSNEILIVKILKRNALSLKFSNKLTLYRKINYLILQLHWKNSILRIINTAQY